MNANEIINMSGDGVVEQTCQEKHSVYISLRLSGHAHSALGAAAVDGRWGSVVLDSSQAALPVAPAAVSPRVLERHPAGGG